MILFYFSGRWCAPCKAFAPVVERVAQQLGIEFKPVDVQKDPGLASDQHVQAVPSLRLMHEGVALYTLDGVTIREAALREALAGKLREANEPA